MLNYYITYCFESFFGLLHHIISNVRNQLFTRETERDRAAMREQVQRVWNDFARGTPSGTEGAMVEVMVEKLLECFKLR
jgi:hypothetical protein